MLSAMDLAVQIGRGSLLHFSTGGHVIAFVVAQPCQAKLLGAGTIKAIAFMLFVIVMIVMTFFFFFFMFFGAKMRNISVLLIAKEPLRIFPLIIFTVFLVIMVSIFSVAFNISSQPQNSVTRA